MKGYGLHSAGPAADDAETPFPADQFTHIQVIGVEETQHLQFCVGIEPGSADGLFRGREGPLHNNHNQSIDERRLGEMGEKSGKGRGRQRTLISSHMQCCTQCIQQGHGWEREFSGFRNRDHTQ